MISLDISVLYQIVIFLVVWFVLSRVLFRPYMEALQERERKTGGAMHDTSALEGEGARLKAEYEEKITQARGLGASVKDSIVQEARQEREQLIQQAREEAARELEEVRRDIAAQLERERGLATAEVTTLAQDMVGKILGRRVA